MFLDAVQRLVEPVAQAAAAKRGWSPDRARFRSTMAMSSRLTASLSLAISSTGPLHVRLAGRHPTLLPHPDSPRSLGREHRMFQEGSETRSQWPTSRSRVYESWPCGQQSWPESGSTPTRVKRAEATHPQGEQDRLRGQSAPRTSTRVCSARHGRRLHRRRPRFSGEPQRKGCPCSRAVR
jgi:hypothetical protein